MNRHVDNDGNVYEMVGEPCRSSSWRYVGKVVPGFGWPDHETLDVNDDVPEPGDDTDR